MESEKLFYKFRTIDALLGDRKELETQTIFFPNLEQLNDPLEGYVKLLFCADKVLWTNFLKHYLYAFFMFRNYLILSDKTAHTKEDIIVDLNYTLKEKFETENSYYNKLCANVLAEPVIVKLIDSLSSRYNGISQEELTLLFNVLQLYFCTMLFNIDDIVGNDRDVLGKRVINEQVKINCLKNADRVISIFKKNENEVLKLNKCALEFLNYARKSLVQLDNRFDLVVNFPAFYINKLSSMLYSKACVSCFTDKCDNLSMWGIYTDCGKGACLIFNTQVENGKYYLPLRQPKQSHSEIQRYMKEELVPINYCNERKALSFFELLPGRIPLADFWKHWGSLEGKRSVVAEGFLGPDNIETWRRDYWHQFQTILNTKHIDWQYESEYRIFITPLFDDTFNTPKKRLFEYDFNTLSGLIFGIHTSESDKRCILEILKAKCKKENRSNFKVYQAYYDNEQGKIIAIPLSLWDVEFPVSLASNQFEPGDCKF